MARVTAGGWIAATALGILLATFAMPQTRWILLNQVDVLAGGWRQGWAEFGVQDGPYLPVRLTESEHWVGLTEDSRLAKAMDMPRRTEPDDLLERPYRGLEAYCREHPGNLMAWAQLVRLSAVAASAGVPPRLNEKPADRQLRANRQELAAVVIEACLRCEPQDADNAFFPLMRASALHTLGREREARAAFEKAAMLKRYDNYAMAEADIRSAAVFERWGFRGNIVRAIVLASTILPDYTAVGRLCPALIESGSPSERLKARLDTARVGRIIASTSRDAIGIPVGSRLFQAAVRGKDRPDTFDAAKLRPYADDFRAELAAAGLPSGEIQKAFVAFEKVNREFRDSIAPPKGGSLDALDSRRTLYGAAVLLALLLILPSAWMMRQAGRLNASGPPRRFVSALGVLLAAAVGAGMFAFQAHDQGSLLDTMPATIVGVGSIVLVFGFFGRGGRASVAPAFALFSVLYLGAVSWELQDDAMFSNLSESLLNQADSVRSQSRAFSLLAPVSRPDSD